MQITSLTQSSTVTATNSYKAVDFGTDQAQLGMSADDLNGYIQAAKQVPEVREDLVAHFKNQIANGFYPPPAIMNGLTKLIGGGFLPLDKVIDSSESSVAHDVAATSNAVNN